MQCIVYWRAEKPVNYQVTWQIKLSVSDDNWNPSGFKVSAFCCRFALTISFVHSKISFHCTWAPTIYSNKLLIIFICLCNHNISFLKWRQLGNSRKTMIIFGFSGHDSRAFWAAIQLPLKLQIISCTQMISCKLLDLLEGNTCFDKK